MRNLLIGSLTVVGAVLVSGHSEADPGVLQAQPPVHISAFGLPLHIQRVGAPPAKYTGGPIDVTVSVENSGKTVATNIAVKLRYGPYGAGELTTKTIPSLAPNATTTVTFTDPKGLDSICHPRPYLISLTANNGSETPITDTQPGEVVPNCTFTSSLIDPWNLATPDSVEYAKQNVAYFTDAELVGTPTCTAGVTVKGTIANHTKLSSPSLLVQIASKDPITGKDEVKAQSPAAFPLGAGEFKKIVIPPYGRPDLADVLEVQIIDWTHSLKNQVRNQGITIKTTKSCTLTAKIPPPMAIATEPAKK